MSVFEWVALGLLALNFYGVAKINSNFVKWANADIRARKLRNTL